MNEPIFIKCNELLSKVEQERFMYDIKKKMGDQPVILLSPFMDVVHPAQRWIPVTERLPEKAGVYLVTILNREWKDGDIVQGEKPKKDEFWENHANMYAERPDGKWVAVEQRVFQNDVRPIWSGYGEQVLAWMPLPKPYTEVKSNDNDQ